MNKEILLRIQETISQAVGMDFFTEITALKKGTTPEGLINNFSINFRPEVPEYPSGYCFRVTFFSKRFDIQFVPDTYALPLIHEMEKNIEGQATFCRIASSMVNKSTLISMKINDQRVNIENPSGWGNSWRRLEIYLQKYSEAFDIREITTFENSIVNCATKFFLMVILMMPIEENKLSSPDVEGLPEGAKIRVEVNRYERNPLNRAACIAINGAKCKVCGFDFEITYGQLGKDFIHVHHITPISEIGKGYTIVPAKDLAPVCPNCHAMLHRFNSPLTLEELKKILEESQKAKPDSKLII